MGKGRIGSPTTLHHLLFGIRGYNSDIMKTYKSIITFSINDQARFRLKVIEYFDNYGLAATKEAFGVSRATIYRWKKRLKDSGGKLSSLIPKSTCPKRVRTMMVEPIIIEYIAKLRRKYPNLGKRKIKPFLDEYCRKKGLKPISESTIGKVISRYQLYFSPSNQRVYHDPASGWARKARERLKRQRRNRVRYSPKPKSFGYLEIDTIVKFISGIKVYIYNALDVKLKFQFSLAYSKANSRNTLDFFKKLNKVYPLKNGIKTVQTDNGAEYQGVFDDYLKQKGIKHLFIYPRCPKINAFVERANRTLKEEFINHHLDLALTDLKLFNQKLIKYLIWYNTKRPHYSLNNKSPINYLLEVAPESQKYVTYTKS